jgi:high frequency lysogenization protein
MSVLRDRTLALAGVFQSAALVHQIATTGMVDQHDLGACIRSTLQTDPQNTDEVYGDLENLRTGLHTLIMQLGDTPQQRDIHIARYVISLLHLQRKLRRRQDMLNTIAEGLERAKQQCELFGETHNNVVANLAGIYSDTVSHIPPKIMVSGDSSYLANTGNADKIRAILMTGIRSAVLWAQLGGNRWNILFKRRRFVEEAKRILEQEVPRNLH